MRTLLISLFIFLVCHFTYAQVADRTPVQSLSNSSISYFNGYSVDVETRYTGATAGAKLIACLADAALPTGAICDMRGIASEVSQPVAGGTAPIEIGRNGPQHVIFPDCIAATFASCGFILQTTSTLLPTPSAGTLTCSGSGGTLPVGTGTYFAKLAYYTGDAFSVASAEFSCTSTGVLPGNVSVVLPACIQYSSQVNVYLSTTTGAETLQMSGTCGTTVSFGFTDLIPNQPAAPTTALPLPAIILHNNKSTIYAPMSGQNGFPFFTMGSFVASDLLATTDIGYSGISNIFFDNNANYAIVSAVYDRGAFITSIRDNISVAPGSAATGASYTIAGQYNDVSFYKPNFSCGGANVPTLAITFTPETGGDVEAAGRINIFGGLVNTKGCANTTTPGVVITGRNSSGSTYWTGQPSSTISNVNFFGTSFEMSNTATNAVLATDVSNVGFFGVFGQRGATGGTAFLSIQQSTTITGQTSSVGGFSIIGSPNIFNWVNIVSNGADTDPAASPVVTNVGWTGTYEYGGNVYSKTSSPLTVGKVIANLPSTYDSLSPITTWSHLNFQQITAPVASSCTGGTAAGTDNVFKVTGLSSATTCTVTFNKPLQLGICTGPVSQLNSLPIGITSVSTTAVTFNFASTVTSLYAQCY